MYFQRAVIVHHATEELFPGGIASWLTRPMVCSKPSLGKQEARVSEWQVTWLLSPGLLSLWAMGHLCHCCPLWRKPPLQSGEVARQAMAWADSQQPPAWAHALQLSGECLWLNGHGKGATCNGVRQHQEFSSWAAASSYLCPVIPEAPGPAARTMKWLVSAPLPL